jgi:predicted acetyltransferase
MIDALEYDKFDDRDRDAHDSMMRQSFGTTAERNSEIRSATGTAEIRVLRQRGRTIAALTCLPCGQYFGGYSVPTGFIAGVAVEPDQRGSGRATELLRHVLFEARERGQAQLILYATNYRVYRKVGFERAGSRLFYSAPTGVLASLPQSAAHLPVAHVQVPDPRSAGASNLPVWQAIRSLYRRFAESEAGLLDRPVYFWGEKFAPLRKPVDVHLIGDPTKPEGYIAIHHERTDTLKILDWAATSGSALAALLSHLAGYRANWPRFQWYGAPADLLSFSLPERGWQIDLAEDWMTRLTDVRTALLARGYPARLTARLSLEVSDPIVPANAGRYVLTVAESRAMLDDAICDAPSIALDVGTLATLYTGHAPARLLARAGRIEGSPRAIEIADSIFSGPRPWMLDIF